MPLITIFTNRLIMVRAIVLITFEMIILSASVSNGDSTTPIDLKNQKYFFKEISEVNIEEAIRYEK